MAQTPPWDHGLTPIGSPDHVHAVGALALYFNDLEMTVFRFFQLYIGLHAKARNYLFFTLTNRERIDFILEIASQDTDAEQADAVRHALRCFEIVAENRNILLHGIPHQSDANSIAVLKAASGSKDGMLRHYRFSLQEVREAARNAAITSDYIMELCEAVETRRAIRQAGERPGLIALPQKPPQPNKLSPPPPPKAPKGGKSQPQSSRG